jgi:aspartate-semialdehyde dehydrogenase
MTRVAVVAPNSLLGRELRERLGTRPDLFGDVRLLSSDEDEIGQLAESGGAAAFVGRLDDEAFDGIELAFFCGAIADDRPWIERLPETARAIVLSHGATSADAEPAIAGHARTGEIAGALLTPHPAAYGAALLLARLAPFGVRGAQAVALLPVSTRGAAALEELFEQTRALLAFRSPGKRELRGQLAFNLALSAADSADVARQVVACLGADYPFSIQLLDAGVFHGVGLSLRIELGASPEVHEIRRALGADPRIELARKPAGVSPVALAGSDRLVVGEIRPAGAAGALWIWAAFDNLTRGGAAAAIELADELLGDAMPPS